MPTTLQSLTDRCLKEFDEKFEQGLDVDDVRIFLRASLRQIAEAAIGEMDVIIDGDTNGCMQECCSMGGGLGNVDKGVCRLCILASAKKRIITASQLFLAGKE